MKRSRPLTRKTPLRARQKRLLLSTRVRLLDRAGWACQRCGQSISLSAMHAHHVVKRSQGGTDDLSNLVALCFICHDVIERNPAEAVRDGWTIQRGKVAAGG